jgi:hypothetical protein
MNGPMSPRSTTRIHSGFNTHALREPILLSQWDLPRQAARLGRKRDDRYLSERWKDLVLSQDEHRTTLIRSGETKPADIAAPDHGNSAMSSSSMGPLGPCSAHAFQILARVAGSNSRSASSIGETATRTRLPSSPLCQDRCRSFGLGF